MIEIPIWVACVVPWIVGCVAWLSGWITRVKMHEANDELDRNEREWKQ